MGPSGGAEHRDLSSVAQAAHDETKREPRRADAACVPACAIVSRCGRLTAVRVAARGVVIHPKRSTAAEQTDGDACREPTREAQCRGERLWRGHIHHENSAEYCVGRAERQKSEHRMRVATYEGASRDGQRETEQDGSGDGETQVEIHVECSVCPSITDAQAIAHGQDIRR